MNGDQQSQTPRSEAQHSVPVDNPPSLIEPGPTRPVVQVAASEDTAAVQSGAREAEGGFYHPEHETGSFDDAGTVATPLATPINESSREIEWVSSGDSLMANAAAWRFRMIIVALVVGPLIYLITRSIMSGVSVTLITLIFGFLGSRKPMALRYRLDRRGITIGQKQYSYGEFRAFAVANEAGAQTVNLVPLKRFTPLLAMHLDPEKSGNIIDILSTHLPMETPRRDAFDQIVNKIIRI